MTESEPSGRPLPRPANLRRAPLTFRICMVAVAIGIAAIVTAAVLWAAGTTDLPWWLWVLVALLPIGFSIGAFSIRSAGMAAGAPERPQRST